MTPRCLLGPVGDEFIAEYLGPLRAAGRCRAFGPGPAADLRVHPRDSWTTPSPDCPPIGGQTLLEHIDQPELFAEMRSLLGLLSQRRLVSTLRYV